MLAFKKIETVGGDLKHSFPFSNRVHWAFDSAVKLSERQPFPLQVRNERQPTLVLKSFVTDLPMMKLSLIASPSG